jgi:Amt family ammonium transporter
MARDLPSRPRRPVGHVLTTARARRRREEPFWTALFEAHPQPVLLADAATLRVVGANRAACARYGYDETELATLLVTDLHPHEDLHAVRAAWALRGPAGRAPFAGTQVAKDGATFAVEVCVTAAFVLRGQRVRMTVVNDVTDRDNALAKARASDARYRQIVDTAMEGVVTIDPDQVLSVLNQQASDMLGYAVDEAVQPHVTEIATDAALPGDDVGPTGEREMTLRRKNGSTVSVLLSESPLVDSGGAYAGQLGMITDLSQREQFAAELTFRSRHDPLTGLPNRLVLVDRLERALRRATHGNQSVAVALLDVDGFTDVNTTYGVACGDELLNGIAARLVTSVGADDIVARFGGDEFAVVLGGIAAERAAVDVAERIVAAFDEPFEVAGEPRFGSASVGVVVTDPDVPRGASELLSDADAAMYRAKESRRGGFEIFDAGLRATITDRLRLEQDLRQALDDGRRLWVAYQPYWNLPDRTIAGVEALVRWDHPVRGSIPPAEFIPVAEDSGLIVDLGARVLREACREVARLRAEIPAAAHLRLTVNLSARQVASRSIVDTVASVLAETGMLPEDLGLELTEHMLIEESPETIETITALQELGVGLILDDFGTGYSSLRYLQRYPLNGLKIDRSFVDGLGVDGDGGGGIVEAIIGMARALDMRVVPEGVETEGQLRRLEALGCEFAQGFLLSRPLTPAALKTMLRAGGRPASA